MNEQVKVGTIWTVPYSLETRIVVDKVEDGVVYYTYKHTPQDLINLGVLFGRRGERMVENFTLMFQQIYTIEGFEL